MTDPVEQTLATWRRTAFAYGQTDCMLSIGDYIVLCGGLDVTGRFRGRYDTEVGAREQMRLHGGVAGLLHLAGVEPVAGKPERGDIVALAVDGGADEIGALCTGGMIAARLERGVIEVATRLVDIRGVWRCP